MGIETLDLSNIEFRSPNDIKGFICVENKIRYHDSEKGYTENRAVIQRLSDKKFFAIVYSKWPSDQLYLETPIANEVFRREEIKVSYY